MKNEQKEKFHDRVFYYGLILCVITLPYSFPANSISVMVLSLNWLLEGRFADKFRIVKSNLPFWVFVCFYIVHIVGLAYTTNMAQGLFELEKKLSLLAFPIILATSKRLERHQIYNICKAFFIATLAATIICLGNAVYRTSFFETFPNINWLWFSYRDLTMILNIQSTYLALYVCFSALFLLHLLLENFQRYSLVKKAALFFTIFYLAVFMFLLASRVAIAALVIISFLRILHHTYKSGKLLNGFIAIILIAIVLTSVIFQMPLVKERLLQTFGVEQDTVWISQYGDGTSKPGEARQQTWTSAWNVLKENFVTGTGTGDVQYQLQLQHKNMGFSEGFESQYNSHNQYMETWIMLGIPGLLLLLGGLVLPAIKSLGQKDYLHLSFIILIMLSWITECMLCRQHGVVFYALFSTLFTFHPSGKGVKGVFVKYA